MMFKNPDAKKKHQGSVKANAKQKCKDPDRKSARQAK
jgi:hypothetical protein